MKRKGIENKPYIRGMMEIRQSNKAGSHLDRRERRIRTRLAKKQLAIKEQY